MPDDRTELHLQAQQVCLRLRRKSSRGGASFIPEDYADAVVGLYEPLLSDLVVALEKTFGGPVAFEHAPLVQRALRHARKALRGDDGEDA